MEVNLAVSEKTLALEATPDGIQHGNLEVALVVYDRYGNQMNWLVRKIELSLSPEQYKAYGDTGLQFQFAFDAPRGAAYLRSGVCDLASRKAGTLEVPLSAPPAMPQEAKSN